MKEAKLEIKMQYTMATSKMEIENERDILCV